LTETCSGGNYCLGGLVVAQFKAFAPGVEVNGETVLSVVAGLGGFEAVARKILADNGIADPQPGKWYPQQAWLDSFKAIATKVGPSSLFSIGKAIPDQAQWPPQVTDLDSALPSIDMAYHMNHRGGDIGTYGYESTGPKTARMVCRNPYPCEFDRGIVTSVARRFKPKGVVVVDVTHDMTAPCRGNGADSCTYLVSW
jgi:hypothetical protein